MGSRPRIGTELDSRGVVKYLIEPRSPYVEPIRLPVVCRCPLEYSTREHGRRTITFRVHREDCALAQLVADRDACR